MYYLLKKIITEKDIYRHVSLLEQLLNNQRITAKELAALIQTTERTIFSDLQLIRSQLPEAWKIETNSSGIRLVNAQNRLTNELWELFLPQSASIQLIKELFFSKKLTLSTFLQQVGLSLETLKRHTAKINKQLTAYHIQIKLSSTHAQWYGEESAIRIFYHRLLLPFTHNNYFFEDYSIHEGHYFHFLTEVNRSALSVDTEQIFGTCWFFINTIRTKANCRINHFTFNATDSLFTIYHPLLKKLYEKEGIYLQGEEIFFAFFCFMESWNYNNQYGPQLLATLNEQYSTLSATASQFVAKLALELDVPALTETTFADNLLIVFLKYTESATLSEQFQLEYQEVLTARHDQYGELQHKSRQLLEQLDPFHNKKTHSYLLNLISLVGQQAIFSAKPRRVTVYFVFQGEPAWKNLLQQELGDFLGKHIHLEAIELTDLNNLTFEKTDFIVSNFPLEQLPIPIVYISTNPTKNELRRLTELTLGVYI